MDDEHTEEYYLRSKPFDIKCKYIYMYVTFLQRITDAVGDLKEKKRIIIRARDWYERTVRR